MTKEKPHNNGQWTAARFHSFIKGALRAASVKWPPKNEAKKEARVERGIYKCVGYKKRAHKIPASIKVNGKRKNNVQVDHIVPVIGADGFKSWDDVISRMFCEMDGLQILCDDCHKRKTADERLLRKEKK